MNISRVFGVNLMNPDSAPPRLPVFVGLILKVVRKRRRSGGAYIGTIFGVCDQHVQKQRLQVSVRQHHLQDRFRAM